MRRIEEFGPAVEALCDDAREHGEKITPRRMMQNAMADLLTHQGPDEGFTVRMDMVRTLAEVNIAESLSRIAAVLSDPTRIVEG